VDDLIVVSCTGLDIPGLDLRLAGRLGMRPDLRRTCVLGMGCYAAFPGLLRAREAAGTRPGRTALVLAIELCSLHFQPGNPSTENVVISALFGDGAAAVLVGSEENAIQEEERAGVSGPYLLDSLTHSDYQTLEHMAFHVTDHGFLMRLSPEVPDVLAANVEGFVGRLLAKNGVGREDIRFWCVHPGGVKILDYTQACLGLSEDDLSPSRSVLYQYGNMSSATVLFVLQEIQRQRRPEKGDYGVMMAFGPGLTLEGGLVQW
jgi:predicted naringenin-chalcone synthase